MAVEERRRTQGSREGTAVGMRMRFGAVCGLMLAAVTGRVLLGITSAGAQGEPIRVDQRFGDLRFERLDPFLRSVIEGRQILHRKFAPPSPPGRATRVAPPIARSSSGS
jgi:hypothetical protein